MEMSRHAAVRAQQRNVSPLIIDWLLEYGSRSFDKHGAELRFFDKRSRKALSARYGGHLIGNLSKQLDAYLVVSNGAVLTTGFRTKRIKRSS